jgi:DNA-binding XRE family transcriptional regulator
MVNQPQLSKHSSTGVIDDALIIAVQKYRKQARMTQGLFAHFCGVTDKIISNFERHLPASDDTRGKIKAFLAGAPRQPTLTKKLLTWAQVTNMPSEGIEAVRALKEAYDRAKREEGLASIPLIQLEVENALTLATRGHYYKNRNK